MIWNDANKVLPTKKLQEKCPRFLVCIKECPLPYLALFDQENQIWYSIYLRKGGWEIFKNVTHWSAIIPPDLN